MKISAEHTGPAGKPVGIWIRVSTEDQVRGESPEVHEQRARMYAELRAWQVREVYRLDAVSGKSVMGHPEAQRMLGDIRAGRITGLVFSKLARLARNTKELLEFAEEFRKYDADLISLQEAIDTSSPAGRFFFTLIGAMAQWEREEIAARVAASVPIRAKLGKPIGGQAPFGYCWQNKRLVPDANEAPIRTLIYQLFAEHRRKKTVARLLNERGYRTRSGSKWSDTTVDRLIRDPTAKGVHRANYTRTNDRTKSWELKPESEWVLNSVEPIVDDALWQRCNEIISARQGSRKRQTRKAVHLFAGFAYCGCGEKMYVWTNSPKYVCPKCRNKIPIADLEAVYRDQLSQFLLSPEDIEAHFVAAGETIQEKERLITKAEEELRRIEIDDDRLYQLYLADKITKDDFGRRHKPLSERRTQLESELPRLQAELDVLRIASFSSSEALAEAKDLSGRWEHMSNDEKRQIVEMITSRIVVKQGEVEIDLLYSPPFRDCAGLATRPCRCGYLSEPAQSCGRAPKCAQDYQARLSGPLLDRIDIHVEVSGLSAADLSLPPPAEGSADVAKRVAKARDIQRERYSGAGLRTNAEAEGELLDRVAKPDSAGQKLLMDAAERIRLTARGYHRVLRVARTIADLAGADAVNRGHVAEAISYRRIAHAG